jgi:hypothetical protein
MDDAALASDPIGYSIRNKIPNFGIYQTSELVKLGGFDLDPAVLYNEDVAFHTKLALAGLKFRASNLVTSINWRFSTSMSGANQVKCLKAHSEVMWRVAAQVGSSYGPDLAKRFWNAATGFASYMQWSDMDIALERAQKLSPVIPDDQSRLFARLCRVVAPPLAFRIREAMIRRFKPHLRIKAAP